MTRAAASTSFNVDSAVVVLPDRPHLQNIELAPVSQRDFCAPAKYMRYDVCRGERPSSVFSGQTIDEGPPRRLVTIVHNRYRCGAFNSAASGRGCCLNLSSPWRCDPALPRQTHAARGVQRRFGGSHARSCRLAPGGVRGTYVGLRPLSPRKNLPPRIRSLRSHSLQ